MRHTPPRLPGKIPNKPAHLSVGAHVSWSLRAGSGEMEQIGFAGWSHVGSGCVLMSRPLMWKSAALRAELLGPPLSRAQVQLPPSSPANSFTAPAALVHKHGWCRHAERRRLNSLMKWFLTSKCTPLLQFILRGMIGFVATAPCTRVKWMPVNQGIIGHRALINGTAPLWVKYKWGRFQGSISYLALTLLQLSLVERGTDAVSHEPGLESGFYGLTTMFKRNDVFHNEVI